MTFLNHVPEAARTLLAPWLHLPDLRLILHKPRKTKLGDYRPPRSPEEPHRITVNKDLSPELFLITTLHELAHYVARKRFGADHDPHGAEWKNTYKEVSAPYLRPEIFEPALLRAYAAHLRNPKASTAGDVKLWRLLRPGAPREDLVQVESLAPGQAFILENGLTLVKGPRGRSRYRCPQHGGRQVYLVHALAWVKPVEGKL